MKKIIGKLFMLTGAVLVIAALALFLSNQNEAARAEASVDSLAPRIAERISENTAENPGQLSLPDSITQDREMKVESIDGYGYIGLVSIPSLNLELPVMAEWSYPQLKTAPCRYSGTIYRDDLVIMAHNYARHFGNLNQLSPGDTVTFTDMEGTTVAYQVAAMEVLQPQAVEEMTAGDYDLTLFTCTYGGASRVTIRCDRTQA